MDIHEIRQKTGLSRIAFAKRYDIPLRTIEDWESGKRKPPTYVIRLLGEAVERDLSLQSERELFTLVNRSDFGEGFSSETYRSNDYEVSVVSSQGSVSIKASPLKSWLPEVHMSNGNVTKIGFTGDIILEENLLRCARGLAAAPDILNDLRERFCDQ